MSLEAMFAELKIDDAASIVECIKKEGSEKSGFAANVTVLAARCDSNNDAECIAALKTVTAIAKECPQAQAFTKECLGACKFVILNDLIYVLLVPPVHVSSYRLILTYCK